MSAAAVVVVVTSGERSRRKGRRGVNCYLQVKLCDPRLSAFSVVATIKALYKYTSFLSFPFLSCLADAFVSSGTCPKTVDLVTAHGDVLLLDHGTNGCTNSQTTQTVPSETPGGVLSSADMAVERRDGRRLKPNSITLSGRRQVRSWSQTCGELEFGLSSSSLAS